MKHFSRRFFSIALACISFFAILGIPGVANAAGEAPLSTYSAGDVVSFAGYTWIVLHPATGYLIMEDLGVSEIAFDSANTNSFDPSISTNIGYYLNTTFYGSLPPAAALIQTHTWGTGTADFNGVGDESATTVDAKVGLISHHEWTAYRAIVGDPPYGVGFWTRTTTPSDILAWMVVPTGLGGDEKRSFRYARPTLYLPSDVLVSDDDTVTGSFSVTYHLDGGTNDAANTDSYAYGTGLSLAAPTKDSYRFIGWYDNGAFSGSPVTAITGTDLGAKTLYAAWVELHAPAPHSTVPTQTMDIGGSASFTAADIAEDIDNDPLDITAIVSGPNPAIASADLTGGTVTVTGVAGGSTSLTVTVSDGTDTVNISVPVVVNAEDTYEEHSDRQGNDDSHILADSTTGITVSGNGIRANTALIIKELSLDDPNESAACDAIRQYMADHDSPLICVLEISLSRSFTGALTITVPVDPQYNGQTVTILHYKNGVLEAFTARVVNGTATFTATSLSPFAVLATPGDALDDIPKTGDDRFSLIWWILCGVSAAGITVLTWGNRRKTAVR